MAKTCTFVLAFFGPHVIFFPPAAHCLLTIQEEQMKSAVIPSGYTPFLPPWKKGDPAVLYVGLSSVDFDVITGGDTRCPFRIGIQQATEDQVQLHWLGDLHPNKSSIHMHHHAAQVEIGYELSKLRVNNIAGNHRVLQVTFAFSRGSFSSILTLWLPGALCINFAWAGPWFRGAGIFLPCASLLCVGVHGIQLKTMLQGHDLLTALDVWLSICQVFILAAFLQYALACSTKSHRWDRKRLKYIETGVCEHHFSAHGYMVTAERATQTPVTMTAAEVDLDYYDRIARSAYPPVFVSVIVVYWIYYFYLSVK